MGIYDFTLYDLFLRNEASFGEKTAWIEAEDNRSLSFARMRDMVDRLAAGLKSAGAEKGDRLAILGKNRLEYFLLLGAAARSGTIALPVNWRLSPEEMARNLEDGDPVLIFADPEYQPLLQGLEDRLGSLKSCFTLGRDPGEGLPLSASPESDEPCDGAEVGMEDPFLLIHTAATAGRPMGALLSHKNLLLSCANFANAVNVTPRDVHLNVLPLFHVAGLFATVAAFSAGALTVNMAKFHAPKALEMIEQHKCSLLFDFHPILSTLLQEQARAGTDMGPLRTVVGVDTAETAEEYERRTGGTFYSIYGQTEGSAFSTICRHRDRPGSIGRSMPFVNIRLTDDSDRPVPVGEVGEITQRGPTVFQGYRGRPEETAYTFRNGWHHTGDMGRVDPDGYLWYEGHKTEKELIKPGGENVYPAEVEKAVLEHPAVERVVVFGVPDPKWKEGVKAVCQLKPGHDLTAQDLIDFVGRRIAGYKKPRYVEFTSEIPLLEDGTPDRAEVKRRYQAVS